MKFHILNGDALAAEFPIDGIPGEIIVIREAFIDGPVSTIYEYYILGNRVRSIFKIHILKFDPTTMLM
jgi:hypothetical protein